MTAARNINPIQNPNHPMRLFEWISAAVIAAILIYAAFALWQGFNDPYSLSLSLGG